MTTTTTTTTTTRSTVVPPPPPPPPPATGNRTRIRALDKDIDEELLLDIPPPPTRQRTPISPLHPKSNKTTTTAGAYYGGTAAAAATAAGRNGHAMSRRRSGSSSSSGAVPPASPSTGSPFSSSRIESFHRAILDNIESSHDLMRRSSGLSSSTSFRRPTVVAAAAGGETGSSSSDPATNTNPGSNSSPNLLAETFQDISIGLSGTVRSLKTVLQQARGEYVDAMDPGGSDAMGSAGFFGAVPPPPTRTTTPSSSSAIPRGSESNSVPRQSQQQKQPVPTNDFTKLLSKWCGIQDQAKSSRGGNENSGTGGNSSSSSSSAMMMGGTAASSSLKAAEETMQAMAPHIARMQEAVSNAMTVDNLKDFPSDLWKTVNGETTSQDDGETLLDDCDDDDQRTIGTLDSGMQEETSQLRRLGSWGTVGSGYTAGTFGTYETSSLLGGGKSGSSGEQETTNADLLGQLPLPEADPHDNVQRDDEGRLIDPVLLEKTQKTRGKRQNAASKKTKKRRTRKVKFEYPPIKSLRQYVRPDPEDLPKLFFTEQELDQIEEDRFGTMSTDDIEIVAVSSKLTTSSGEDDSENGGGSTSKGTATPVKQPSPKNNLSSPGSKKKETTPTRTTEDRDSPSPTEPVSIMDEPHEKGFRPVKGRSGTPIRRRQTGSVSTAADEEMATTGRHSGASPKSKKKSNRNNSSSGRLVKGVQIYLRERSTGA